MTIDGFWDTVNQKHPLGKYRVNFKDYVNDHYHRNGRFLTVGIDIFQWIFENNNNNKLPEDDIGIAFIVSGIASKLRYLKSLAVNFVIVFDGSIKLDKMRRGTMNLTENLKFEDRYNAELQAIKNNEHITNGKVVTKLREMLKSWNISYIFAVGDGEIELARLNQANVIDAIISNDADGFAYGAKTILRNFSRNMDDKPNSQTRGKKNTTEFFVTPVNYDIFNEMYLDADKIMFIACISGDDFSKGVNGMGIKKVWSLATNTFGDFNVVQEFKDIYVSKEENDYIHGLLPHKYEKRIKLLDEYSKNLSEHITKNARQYFRHNVTSAEVKLPSDYILATHYYPHFARQLFRFNNFDTNMNNISGNLTSILQMPILPQPLSIISSENNKYELYRGNSEKPSLGSTKFINNIAKETEMMSNKPYTWFESVEYNDLFKWMRYGNSNKEKMEYIAETLGKCTIWNAIVCYKKLNLKLDDIFIKKQEIYKVKGKDNDFQQTMLQVKYKPRQIYKTLLLLPENLIDENLRTVEEKHVHIWMPSYLFEIEDNGRHILRMFTNEKLSNPSTPKHSPNKKNIQIQKTKLDSLSKSPIKFKEEKTKTLLQVSDAVVTNISNKRTIESVEMNGSPKKKIKPTIIDLSNSESDSEVIQHNKVNNSALDNIIVEDEEVSRVLDNSNYVTENNDIITDSSLSGIDEFFDAHESVSQFKLRLSKQQKFIDKFGNQEELGGIYEDSDNEIHINHQTKQKTVNNGIISNTGNFINSLHNDNNRVGLFSSTRKEFKKGKLTLTRGISEMDQRTRLPEVPKEPDFEINVNLKEEIDDLSDFTFGSTDSMIKIFGDDVKDVKENKIDNINSKNNKSSVCSPSRFTDDSLSSIDFDAIIKNDVKLNQLTNIEDKKELNDNIICLTSDSDHETTPKVKSYIELMDLTPIVNRNLNFKYEEDMSLSTAKKRVKN